MTHVKIPVQFMGKVAEYIKESQTIIAQLRLEKEAQYSRMEEKIACTVGSMIEKGYASSEDRHELIREFTTNPVKMAEVLDRVIREVELPSLGAPSGELDAQTLDPLTRFALEGPQSVII